MFKSAQISESIGNLLIRELTWLCGGPADGMQAPVLRWLFYTLWQALMVGASGGLWIFIRAFLPVDQPRQTPRQELGEVLTEWILFQVGIKAKHTHWPEDTVPEVLRYSCSSGIGWPCRGETHTHKVLRLTWSAVSWRLNGRERERKKWEYGVSS